MSEKTLNVNRQNNCFRTFSVFLLVCSLLFAFVSPLVVQATPTFNYQDLDYKVKYGTEYNKVYLSIPEEYYRFIVELNPGTDQAFDRTFYNVDSFTTRITAQQVLSLYVYPIGSGGIDLFNVPTGSKLHFTLKLELEDLGWFAWGTPYARYFYMDSNNKWIDNGWEELETDVIPTGEYDFTFEIEDIANAVSFTPGFRIKEMTSLVDFEVPLKVSLSNVELEMDISAAYWTQWQNAQNGEMLGQINDKLDKLPEEIGDQMQNVIDNENSKAESSGNKFVNQILDKLPDPSTDVLSALKKLTDATAYTGTDTKLKIPAIVLPAVDGLFPQTVIWEGVDFSFSDYLAYIPSTLLTVVQSLFTIAIVLFCVYELKGIISYCLTLNDKKVG